jgi:hypothetical protein
MKQRPTVFHNSGEVVEGEMCRKCHVGRVIYNGNYFCENWGYDYEGKRYGGPCDWAMKGVKPGKKRKKKDQRIIDTLIEQRERMRTP